MGDASGRIPRDICTKERISPRIRWLTAQRVPLCRWHWTCPIRRALLPSPVVRPPRGVRASRVVSFPRSTQGDEQERLIRPLDALRPCSQRNSVC